MGKEGVLAEISASQQRIEAIKAGLITDTAKAGMKYDTGKLRYELYPIDAYEGTVKVLTFGANKYTPNGWKTVTPKDRYYAAMMRHVIAQIKWEEEGNKGLHIDDESGLPSLDHAMCCLVFFRELSKKHDE